MTHDPRPGHEPRHRELSDARRRADVTVVCEAALRRRRRRRVLRPLIGLGALVLVAGTGAGVAALGAADAPDTSLIRCHSTLDLGRGTDFLGTSTHAADVVGQRTQPVDALNSCAWLWANGILAADGLHAKASGELAGSGAQAPAVTVPVLIACVDPDGFAAVFPTDGSDGAQCSTLGLTSLRRAA